MGVRCVISGHLYESTEFEEHRRERPKGTVLVCREYQVCSRCGSREEMYRNEQLLTPRERMDGGDPEAGTDAPDASTDGSEGGQSGVGSERNSHDTMGRPSEHADPIDPDPSLEESPQLEGVPNGDVPGSSVTTNDVSTPGTDGEDDADGPEGLEESVSLDSLPGGARATAPDGDDTDDEAKRGSRLQPPKHELAETADRRSDSESRTNAPSRTDGIYSPSKGDTAEDTTADTTDDEPTDDAVIISDDEAPTSSSNQHSGGHATALRCQACGGTWDGETTSLREGDLCPECRREYVEIR